MKQKNKTAIVLSVIFVVTIAIVAYTFKVKKSTNQTVEQSNVVSTQSIENTKTSNQENKSPAPMPKAYALINLDGSVVGFQNNVLEFQAGDTKNDISVVENPYIFQTINGKKVVKKNTVLKQGTKVQISLRTSDSTIVSIEILK